MSIKSQFVRTREEKDVGITEWIRIGGSVREGRDVDGRIRAVIKERYSDFHVKEIDKEGRIVRLTDIEEPKLTIEDEESDKLYEEIKGIVKEEEKQGIKELGQQDNKKDKDGGIYIKVTTLDKEMRTKIHKWIGTLNNLSSETVDKDGEKFILVSKRVGQRGGRGRNDRRPASRKRYTHCVLYKEGMDTGEAAGWIARKLNLKPGLISYAGIKDKRAKTTQRISISNIEPQRLIGICRHSKNIKLGNFEYRDRPLQLGELNGNHFHLLLKDIKLEQEGNECFGQDKITEAVDKAVTSLKTKGFINYYGLQRFGSYDVSTWEIGREVFRQNWMAVFDLILSIKPNDPQWMIEIKDLWLKDRKPQEAVKKLKGRQRSIESHLLHGLARFYDKNGYLNAFTEIPRNRRLLYVHAYQSYLWNLVASYRVREYGLVPVVGDLVCADDGEQGITELEDVDFDDNNERGSEFGPATSLPTNLKVRVLTDNDLRNEKYCICDIVLPLYGRDVKLPENNTRTFLEEVLRKEGIDAESFSKFRPVSDKPTGAYRKVVVIPKNVDHELRAYSDQENLDSFISSDLDILSSNISREQDNHQQSKSTEMNKEKLCILIQFSLPSSSYATMALREIVAETIEQDTDDGVDADTEPQSKRPKIESGNHSSP